nr:VanZ family protein [Saccharopolyspora sp. HNM0983]
MLYALALAAYVLVPFPQVSPGFCARHGTTPQWAPLRFLDDMVRSPASDGLAAVLRDPALTQILLNVALFVPFGMLVRHLGGRSVPAAALLGAGVSLFVESTQGTGIWFLYPCPYRLFDVDDLLANGSGALLGALLAPLLRLVPGQRVSDPDPSRARPVTAARRLLGAVCDLLLINLTGVLLGTVYRLGILAADGGLFAAQANPVESVPGHELIGFVEYWLPWVLLCVLAPLVGSGASPGQRAVRLTFRTRAGARPRRAARLLRSALGIGGFWLLFLVTGALEESAPALPTATGIVLVVSAVGIMLTRHGLSGALSGLRVTDNRAVRGPVAQPTEPVPA